MLSPRDLMVEKSSCDDPDLWGKMKAAKEDLFNNETFRQRYSPPASPSGCSLSERKPEVISVVENQTLNPDSADSASSSPSEKTSLPIKALRGNTSKLPAPAPGDTTSLVEASNTSLSPHISSTKDSRPRPCVPLTRAEAILKARNRVLKTLSHAPFAPSPLANEIPTSNSSQPSNIAQTITSPEDTKATPTKMTQSDGSDEILPLYRGKRTRQTRPRPIPEPLDMHKGVGLPSGDWSDADEPVTPAAQKENCRDKVHQNEKEELARLAKPILVNAHRNRFSDWPTASPELLARCRDGPGTDRHSKEYHDINEIRAVLQADITEFDCLPGSSHVFEETAEDANPAEMERELWSRLRLSQELYKKSPTAFPILTEGNLTLSPTPTAKHKKALARIRKPREMAPEHNKLSKAKNNVQILQASWTDPVILDWEYCPRCIVDENAYHARFQSWLDDTIKRECPVDIFHQAFFNGTAHADGETSMFMLDMRNYKTTLDPEDKASWLHAHENAAGYAHNVVLQNKKAEEAEEHRKQMMRKVQIESRQARPLRSPSSPVANIYLRPVDEKDIPELKEIYGWYAHSSFESPDTLGLSDDEVRQRIEGSRNAMLPFIVAVDRRSASTNTETILGYALAKEFELHRTSQYTAELEVYVKEGHTGLGIGRCLLDKLLEVCDPTYRSRSGYQFEATHQERSGYFPGGRRKLARLLFTLGYVDNEISKYNRVKRWLKEYAEFEEQGVLRGVRIKKKFLVNVSYLVHNVGYSTSNQWEP